MAGTVYQRAIHSLRESADPFDGPRGEAEHLAEPVGVAESLTGQDISGPS
jgi:hypothetical protein